MNFQELLARVNTEVANRLRVVIGIDGCGGAGKSSLADALAAKVDAVGIVHADDFYLPTKLRGHGLNVVAGDQDYQRLIKQVLMPFKRGVPIRYQRYDWKNDRLEDWIVIEPRKVLIIEGIYSTRRELRSMYDLKIWVDCPPETGIARGIERDGEHMRAKWEKEWMPAWTRYARLHRPMESADIVMSGTDAWT